MSSLLLIIDLQKDFININTEPIVKKIENFIEQDKFDNVVFTRFINSEDSIFVRDLNYYGCMDNSSKKIVIDTKDHLVIDKSIYSAFNKELIAYISKNNITDIYLCGIDIECCVLKTAFDLFENEYQVYILKDLCACTHGEERKNNALQILARNIGKNKII